MIKFKSEMNGKPLIGIGLSEENVQRLKDGKPILFDAKQLGIDVSVTIFYGETEEKMVRDFQKHGLISVRTKINPDVNSL